MSNKVRFTPPKDFIAPEDDGKGTFDLVCTFKAESGGQLCLIQLGDTHMPGYDDSKEAKPDYGDMASTMQQSMGGMPEGEQ